MNFGCIDDARRMQSISARGVSAAFHRARAMPEQHPAQSRLSLISQSPWAGTPLSLALEDGRPVVRRFAPRTVGSSFGQCPRFGRSSKT
jgi:hypothetical protein